MVNINGIYDNDYFNSLLMTVPLSAKNVKCVKKKKFASRLFNSSIL